MRRVPEYAIFDPSPVTRFTRAASRAAERALLAGPARASVIVSFQAVATVEGAPAPQPAVTIELVDKRTGASRIVHADTYVGTATVREGTLY